MTSMGLGRKQIVLIAAALLLATGATGAFFILPLADQEENHADSLLFVDQSDENEIDRSIIDFEDMTEEQQDTFKSAIGGSESIPEGVNRSVWINNGGVRYQNETYSTMVAET